VVLLGLLLALGAVGLSFAAIRANQGMFEKSAGTLELFGYTMELTVAQVYLAGLVIGALGFFGFMMILTGAGRRASRRAATRRQLREQEAQLRELQYRQQQADAEARAAEVEAARQSAARESVREARHRRAGENEEVAEERREMAKG
jgi:hypothetical protein